MTTAETFIWRRVNPRLQIGLAHLWRQNAFRALAAWQPIVETEHTPALNLSAGVQGIGTGNPGYAATLEKNFALREGRLNVYGGVGFRSNENHAHFVGGIKYSPSNQWSIGIQDDGHAVNPFVTYSWDRWLAGLYLIESEHPAFMVGARF